MEELLVKPLAEVKRLEMEDPTFEVGSLRTARAVLTNPTMKEFTYFVELYLGVLKVTSASGVVTIPALTSLNVDFILRMPLAEGEHEVYLDVKVGTELLVHYKATENVTLQKVWAYYCIYCFSGFNTTQGLVWHIVQEHYETIVYQDIEWV